MERNGPTEAAKNDMASTVETLKSVILSHSVYLEETEFIHHLIVLDSLSVMEATYVKQLAITEVTPPNIPLRKLARHSQEVSMLSIL